LTLLGRALRRSLETIVCLRALRVSTTGASPLTVTVSESVPTFMSTLIAAVKPDVTDAVALGAKPAARK
jgi:hypothetical protein